MKWMYIIATFSCFIVEATAQPPAISGAIEMEFVRVPPGKFIYGKFEPTYPLPDSSEKYNGYRSLDYAQAKKMAMRDRLPGFEVNIKDSFDIGKYEVTQKQWTTIMGNNPSVFVHENKPADDFKASSYIRYQGEKLVNRFNAHSYWTLTKAMDTHNLSRGRDASSVEILKTLDQRTLVFGIHSDILCPVTEQVFLSNHIPDSQLVVIDSAYGHDGFMVEAEQISQYLRNWWNS